ncbi:fungal-specific transcription factor domain-containing protein [Aspergillus karnatakaensis]|uniref:putative C2H2 finger domain protein n=1 Tax=Aspergillus karnatakaensis TaxID=1810916 RepID=UPI003CCDE15A
MTFAVATMTSLDQDTHRREMDLGSESPDMQDANGPPRKRKRTRKVQLDRKFDCSYEGCGKSYSRAEHLYRHQLNHAPKQIYRCDFPDCYRSFVRQDLCVRHRERHTTQGSQLQKRDHFAQAASATPSGIPKPQMVQNAQHVPQSFAPPVLSPPDSKRGSTGPDQPMTATTIPVSSSPTSVGYNRPFNNYQHVRQQAVDVADSPYSNTSITDIGSPTAPIGFNSPPLQRPLHAALNARQIAHGVPNSDLPRSAPVENTNSARVQNLGSAYAVQTDLNGALVNQSAYTSQAGLQIPVDGYSDISMAPVTSSASAPLDQANGMGVLDSMAGMMVQGSTVGDMQFDAMNSCVYPVFGGESNRSPFHMADDFTAWLFNEPAPGSAVPNSSATNVVPSYMEAQLQNQFLMSDATYGSFLNSVIPTHPMSVTSILDPGSPRAIMSEDKRQELLDLMSTRFNEAAYSAVAKRKDALMDGDMEDDNHVLSLSKMQTYIGSYWYHFHVQLPILHRPTFVADKAPNLLLLAVIAIGAATLDSIHGPEVTEAASELADFIMWHLRWEIFMEGDFRPPAKLWIFQSLLLLEVYEKMYSTRALHERAHIHHDTTLTLMRRGSSLIGRHSFDSPGSLRDDRQARSTSGSTTTPDFAADESWTHWIKTEATRRVAFAAFVLDSTHATMFGHSAKMVAHELRLPLPCDEALWSATSAAEVARVQASLHANGVRPAMFLEGLKRTLNGQRVRTNAFGRTILMAGLLSVSWHLNQRDLQVSSLGVAHALGGRDKWRSSLLRAFDNWRRDFDEALGQTGMTAFPNGYRGRYALDEDNVFESRDVLHGLAHMASHVDVVDCQIFAGARRLMGRTITPRDYNAAREKMVDRWATKASARDATFYALKFLAECLLDSNHGDPDSEGELYCGREDYLLNRPWVIYVAALVVWCYGYALDGPITGAPELSTVAEQRQDMQTFLRRVGGCREPSDLESMKGRNQCLGMLMILRDGFVNARWELLAEAANLLSSCIVKLRGVS